MTRDVTHFNFSGQNIYVLGDTEREVIMTLPSLGRARLGEREIEELDSEMRVVTKRYELILPFWPSTTCVTPVLILDPIIAALIAIEEELKKRICERIGGRVLILTFDENVQEFGEGWIGVKKFVCLDPSHYRDWLEAKRIRDDRDVIAEIVSVGMDDEE